MSKTPRAFRLDDPNVRLGPLPRADEAMAERAVAIQDTDDQAVFEEAVVEEAIEEHEAELGLGKRLFGWGGVFASAAGELLLLWLSVAVERFVADLLASSPTLGAVALGLAALAGVALLALAARELGSIWRGRAIGKLKARAEAALASDDAREGRAILASLASLYASRPETARDGRAWRRPRRTSSTGRTSSGSPSANSWRRWTSRRARPSPRRRGASRSSPRFRPRRCWTCCSSPRRRCG